MSTETDWQLIIEAEATKPYWKRLQKEITEQRQHSEIFPEEAKVFAALDLTPYKNVKVVVLGQDPYHGPGQAHGLSFSVKEESPLPPSLKNIYKELEADCGVAPRKSGDLSNWAKQGVLLLNSVLTVRAHKPASHRGMGWEQFTDTIIRAVNNKTEPVVFILWGSFARSKKTLITNSHHTVIESPHPSPLSAYAGFFGSKPFSRTNATLTKAGLAPIQW